MNQRFSVFALLSRGVDVVLFLLGVLSIVADNLLYLLYWNLAAIIFVIIRLIRLGRIKKQQLDQAAWLRWTLPNHLGLPFSIIVSLFGMVAGLQIGIQTGNEDLDLAVQGIAVIGVILAWTILHFGFADVYARRQMQNPDSPALAFRGDQQLTYVDFCYFSFTVGTSFAVSDVESQTPAIRRTILGHSVLAFLFNAAILSLAIRVLTE